MHSKTPGHPEFGMTPGVETTTGPLGQGLANAVGMALAEKLLAAEFNRPGHTIVDHQTYVFVGDGCLMEGISHEACSLAGTLELGKLIALYDDNGISIDGHVEGWFTDNTPMRFAAYGWHVIPDVDGHDPKAVEAAIAEARADQSKPTLICCKTVIGKGSPNKAGTHDVHGAALGDKEVAATREAIGWPHPPFEVPAAVYQAWDQRPRGAAARERLERALRGLRPRAPGPREGVPPPHGGRPAAQLGRGGRGPARQDEREGRDRRHPQGLPDRHRGHRAAPARLPRRLGGPHRLQPHQLVGLEGRSPRRAAGNYVSFGVREFGMSAIGNGIALHGGFIPYSGTFLVFSDYARNAVRMAALMKLRNIFVYTHDSIGLGEDGPTHQAVEHVSSLRLIPNLDLWRPCDTTETAVAWAAAIERRDGPTAFALSRQNVPFVKRSPEQVAAIRRGGYVLSEAAGTPKAAIIATGSEVSLALAAQKTLAEAGIAVRVVSMPCTSVFDRQDAAWRAAVLPKGLPRVSVEAGVTDFWRKYVGLEGAAIGVDRFGESAPAGAVYKHFGVDAEHVVAAVKSVL